MRKKAQQQPTPQPPQITLEQLREHLQRTENRRVQSALDSFLDEVDLIRQKVATCGLSSYHTNGARLALVGLYAALAHREGMVEALTAAAQCVPAPQSPERLHGA